MVSKIRILGAIGTSTHFDVGMTPLSHKVENFKYFIDISLPQTF
jgi:hypothetical protein